MKTHQTLNQDILIRDAHEGDADIIVALIHQLGEGSDITAEYVPYYLAGRERGVLVAEHAGTAAGLLSYSVRADLFHAGNSVLIEELVVDAGFRGKGIGSALLEALFDRLQTLNCKEVCLAVMPDNEGAIRFYKRHGLVEEALFLEKHL